MDNLFLFVYIGGDPKGEKAQGRMAKSMPTVQREKVQDSKHQDYGLRAMDLRLTNTDDDGQQRRLKD